MPFIKRKNLSIEELKAFENKDFDKIKDLKFQEFMANSYAEKAIIREDIARIEMGIADRRWYIENYK